MITEIVNIAGYFSVSSLSAISEEARSFQTMSDRLVWKVEMLLCKLLCNSLRYLRLIISKFQLIINGTKLGLK